MARSPINAPLDAKTLIAAVVARRKLRAPRSAKERKALRDYPTWSPQLGDCLVAAQARSGMAAHAKVWEAAISDGVAGHASIADGSGNSEKARYLECFFDGYGLACELTQSGKRRGKPIANTGSVTRLILQALKCGSSLASGPLDEIAGPLIREWTKRVKADQRENVLKAARGAFAAGMLLHLAEHGIRHPLLVSLKAASPKRAPLSTSTAPPNERLMDAILAAPDDDAPRLVYADYLLEHDDPRGEFIIIQCTLGRAVSGVRGGSRVSAARDSFDELKQRERQLLHKNGRAWLGPYGRILRKVTWRRGFLWSAEMDALEFVENLALLGRLPLERISLTGYRPKSESKLLDAAPHITISQIDFSENRINERSAAVLASPLFHRARYLSLWANDLSSVNTVRVLREASLPDLEALNVTGTKLTDSGLLELSRAKFWPQLLGLRLHYNADLSDAKIEALKPPMLQCWDWQDEPPRSDRSQTG
jgi:uncharacterized protein (TIGR02996 family)